MRLFKLTLAAFLGVGLWACSNSDEPGQKNDNGTAEGDTWAAITIKYGDNGKTDSRAVNDGQYNDADANETVAAAEKAVKKIFVIVVNNETNEIELTKEFTGNDLNNSKTVAFELTSGSKTFYATVNEHSDIYNANPINNENNIDKVTNYFKAVRAFGTKKIISKDAAIGLDGESDGFLMTSVAPVTAIISANVTKEQAVAGKGNNVKITVDRTAAKVTVVSALPTSATGDAVINNGNIQFAIGNADLTSTTVQNGSAWDIPTHGFYLMQQKENEAYTTPYYSFIPNESGKKYQHIAPEAADYKDISYTSGTTSYAKALYCLENTHATYLQGNTTYAAIRVPIKLNAVTEFTLDGENNVTGIKNGTAPTTPADFYFFTAPTELAGKYVLATDLQKIANDEAAAIAKIKAKYPDAVCKGKYTGGYGYYRAWLNMTETTAPYTSPVYRNHWYELTIKSIKLPGEPDKPAIDPEKPLQYDTNAVVEISIRDWNKVGHDIDLE